MIDNKQLLPMHCIQKSEQYDVQYEICWDFLKDAIVQNCGEHLGF